MFTEPTRNRSAVLPPRVLGFLSAVAAATLFLLAAFWAGSYLVPISWVWWSDATPSFIRLESANGGIRFSIKTWIPGSKLARSPRSVPEGLGVRIPVPGGYHGPEYNVRYWHAATICVSVLIGATVVRRGVNKPKGIFKLR